MKNIKISIIWALLLGIVLINPACTDLNEQAYSILPADQYTPQTEEDIYRLISPAYGELREVLFAWQGNFDTQEECSDEIVTPGRPNGWIDGGVYRNMHYHIWTSEQSHIGNLWSRCYAGVNYCNYSIYSIENGILIFPDESTKTRILAEMKSLRALYYYLLCDNFGNVPIVTRYDLPADSLPMQNTRIEVYDFIVKELKENIEKLSPVVDATTYARMNKWAAFTLLAKVYQNAEVYTGTAHWQECISACDSVLNSGNYELEANFKDVFKVKNENSKELIFALPFNTSTDGAYGWFHLVWKTLHPANQSTYDFTYAPWGGSCGIPQFIDTYDENDKRREDTWIEGQQFSSAGDTLYCTMKLPDRPLAYTNYVTGIKLAKEYEGLRIGKFEFEKGIGWGGMSNDWPFFRYADIYMMKAEALLRLGNSNDAAQLVTEVRRRAFNSEADATVTGAQLEGGSSYHYGFCEKGDYSKPGGPDSEGSDILYGRMLDELGWEFAAEAHRRQDLIRFGVFTKKSWLSHEPNGDYRTLFPIPEKQLGLNPNLHQNPGYSGN